MGVHPQNVAFSYQRWEYQRRLSTSSKIHIALIASQNCAAVQNFIQGVLSVSHELKQEFQFSIWYTSTTILVLEHIVNDFSSI